MRRSTDRILTTHAGSLPRPETLIESNRARLTGERGRRGGASGPGSQDAVADVVGRSRRARHRRPERRRVRALDGRADRLRAPGGRTCSSASAALELADVGPSSMPPHRSEPGEPSAHAASATAATGALFADAYDDPTSGVMMGRPVGEVPGRAAGR